MGALDGEIARVIAIYRDPKTPVAEKVRLASHRDRLLGSPPGSALEALQEKYPEYFRTTNQQPSNPALNEQEQPKK